MKAFCIFLIIAIATVFGKAAEDSKVLAAAIREVLPEKGWDVSDSEREIHICGPKVKMLFMVSLPAESESKLWRDYARTERVDVRITFQARILHKDLAELRELQARLASIVEPGNREINHLGKDGDAHISEFGFIRLPDYQSETTSIFIQDNVGGRNGLGGWPVEVRPHEVCDVVMSIYHVIESRFEKVNQAFPDEKKKAN